MDGAVGLLFLSHFAFKYIEKLLSRTVCKEPPYKVEESGYAGFLMPIEVYFKNKVSTSHNVINIVSFLT